MIQLLWNWIRKPFLHKGKPPEKLREKDKKQCVSFRCYKCGEENITTITVDARASGCTAWPRCSFCKTVEGGITKPTENEVHIKL